MPPLALPDPLLVDGVALRGFGPGDIDALVAALQDPETPRWTLVPSAYGAQDARDYMRYMNLGRAKGLRRSLAIVAAADPRALLGLEMRAHEANHASRAVAARAGFVSVAAPVIRRPECEHLPDAYYARERG